MGAARGQVDAVVETERLPHATLRRLNGRIVHVTITPFGLDGPRSSWKGNDLVACAAVRSGMGVRPTR